ncbi:MAG: hypothetical protein NAOJABEB_01658 [Steroidobacteraceae bacterium]|nr:hypothetical protein [Steroidobacteraceae bacterium]
MMAMTRAPDLPALPGAPAAPAPVGVAADGMPVLAPLFATLVSARPTGTANDVANRAPTDPAAEALALLLAGMASNPTATRPDMAAPLASGGRIAAPSDELTATRDSALPALDPAQELESILGELLLPEPPHEDSDATSPAAIREVAPARPATTELSAATAFALSRPAMPESTARPAATVHAPPGTHAWSQELAGHIAWIARADLQSASIRLTPEHLGPLDVRISVQDGGATVSFAASHADTRAALEQAMPKLRELLATEGLTLSGATVSEHAPRRDPPSPHGYPAAAFTSDEAAEGTRESAVRLPAGLVDLYA